MMRPCDGTSGLVRGNRRKAVFAFKEAVSQRLSRRVFMARMVFGHITFLVMEYLIRLSYLLP